MQGKIEKESVGTCAWIKEETMERHPCSRLTARPPHSSAGVHVLYCTLHWTCIVLFFSPSSEGGEGKQQQKSRSNCSCAALLFAQRVDGRDGRRLHPRRLFFVFVFHSGVQRKRNKGEGENPQSKQFSAALGTPEE